HQWLEKCSTRAVTGKAYASHRSCGLLNSFLSLCARITNECRRTQGRHGALDQSISDGPLQPADNASAKVFCDVDRGHLIQVGITDFFGDLLSRLTPGYSPSSVQCLDSSEDLAGLTPKSRSVFPQPRPAGSCPRPSRRSSRSPRWCCRTRAWA